MNAVTKTLLSQRYLDICGRWRTDANVGVAGEPGFEPRLTESESAVLPLNYSPIRLSGESATGRKRTSRGTYIYRLGVPVNLRKRSRSAP